MPGRRRVMVALAVGIPCVGQACSADVLGPFVGLSRGDWVQVVCHTPCGRPDDLVAIADAAVAAAAVVLGHATVPVGTVHLEDEDQYRASDQRLNQGRFRENGGFTSYGSREAHISMTPPAPQDVLARFGTPALTRILVAHETTHLAVHALGVRATLPFWLSEGLANRIAASMGVAFGFLDPGEDPGTATYLEATRQALEADRIHLDDIWATGSSAGVFVPYAYATAAYRWLEARHPAVLAKIWNVVGTETGDARPRVQSILREHGLTDEDLLDYLESTPRGWVEQARQLQFGSDTLQLAFPTTDAVAWRWPRAVLPYRVDVEGEFLHGTGGVTLALPDSTYLSAEGGAGRAALVRRKAGFSGLADTLAASTVEAGASLRLSLEVTSEGVRATVGGAVLHTDVDLESARWGLTVRRGGAVRWTGLEVHDSLPLADPTYPQ